jgi:hypothetical protein
MNEINVALIAIVVAVITSISGFITAILKNENLKASIVKRLIKGANGKQLISVADLKYHNIFIKTSRIIATGNHLTNKMISDNKRQVLFKKYIDILCEVMNSSMSTIINTDYINFNESQLINLIVEQMAWRRNEYSKRLRKFLYDFHNDNNEITSIIHKIENWRLIECELINDNIIKVISNGNFTSVEYKLDIIFHQYSMGLDFLAKNGADSFLKLNGDLNNFLNNNDDVITRDGEHD